MLRCNRLLVGVSFETLRVQVVYLDVALRLTDPLNHYLGRRGGIFATCLVSSAACVGQAFTSSWWQLFIARFLLGEFSILFPIYR